MTDSPFAYRSPGDGFPRRVVVGANGAYWRDFGTHYSMCPVSNDNDPIDIVAAYERVELPPERLHEDRQCAVTTTHTPHTWFFDRSRMWCSGAE